NEAVRGYLADSRANADLARRLSEVWKVRDVLKRHVDEQNKLVAEQHELEKMARETRLSLQAIEKNQQAADLRLKLTRRLGETTSRLEQITKRLIETKMTINEHDVRFRDSIRELKLLTALPA